LENNTQHIQQDMIDLRELFGILKKHKKFILGTTAIITMLAIIYIFVTKPMYEIKGLIEIAKIDKKAVQNINDIKQKVETVFEVNIKGKKVELPALKSIEIPNKSESILILKTYGYNNKSAKKKLNDVVHYIESVQNNELDIYIEGQKRKLQLLDKDIQRNQALADSIKKIIKKNQNMLANISKENAALAGIYVIEISKKQTELHRITDKLYGLKIDKANLELSISPFKIQKTKLIGKPIILDKPIKPKKKLIIIVAFITGLMLSVFLAFFLEFLQGIREEKGNRLNG